MSTFRRLSLPTIALHWLIAAGMIGTAALGIIVTGMDRGPDQHALMNIHKALGVITLALALIRIVWRLKEGMPEALGKMPRWQEISAASVHGILLLATIVIPISGLMISIGLGYPVSIFGLPFIPKTELQIEWMSVIGYAIHGTAKYLLIAAIAIHIVGAIKHEVIDKDGTILRMLGFSKS